MPKKTLRINSSAITPTSKISSSISSFNAPAIAATNAPNSVSLPDLQNWCEGWVLDCEVRNINEETRVFRRILVQRVAWFCQRKGYTACDTQVLREFLVYVANGHKEPGGRWGRAHLIHAVSPRTVKDYHGHLRTLFRWLVTEDYMKKSPMENIASPISRADQVQPFTPEHIQALLAQSRLSRHALRDEALVLFLLDTGVRASELCRIRSSEIDIGAKRCEVLGKGNKRRTVYFGVKTAQALLHYMRREPRPPDAPLFLCGPIADEAEFSRFSAARAVKRLADAAGFTAVKCNLHRFRHTFAITILRNGANVFALQQLLGHTTLTMTQRYVALAQADIANQHKMYSPADSLKRDVIKHRKG